jgi:hypothetical protein
MATNREVALAWSRGEEKKSEHLRSAHWSDEDKTCDLYSYALLIGRRWEVRRSDGSIWVVFWLNTQKRSITTTRHQSEARGAAEWRYEGDRSKVVVVDCPSDALGIYSGPYASLPRILLIGAQLGEPVAGVLSDELLEREMLVKAREQEALDLANNGEMLRQ